MSVIKANCFFNVFITAYLDCRRRKSPQCSCYYFARFYIMDSKNWRSCLIPGSLPVPISLLSKQNNKMNIPRHFQENDSVHTGIYTGCLLSDKSIRQLLVMLFDRMWMCSGLQVCTKGHLIRSGLHATLTASDNILHFMQINHFGLICTFSYIKS